MRPNALVAVLIVLALAVPVGAQQVEVDPSIPEYSREPGIAGNLNGVGSDTLMSLMTLWAEGFRKHYPSVKIQIEGKGSSTAPPALTEGTAQLGPMSREMKAEEIEGFQREHGYEPTPIGVALDALAVFVHKDNPIDELSLPEVDAIFSKTRRGGLATDIRTWRGVGLTGSLARRPISLYGRNSASGTYGFFKEIALFKGDYRDTVKEQPGSASVVLGVANDIAGIGYSGMGYMTSGVKALALSKKQGRDGVEPTYENVLSGKYPLARLLWIYVDKKPTEPLSPMIEEFLRFALSQEGQRIVVKEGYLPLPSQLVERELAKLD